MSPDPNVNWEAMNITSINTYGFEFSGKWALKTEASHKGFSLKSIILNYAYLEMDKNSDEYYSKYVLDYLRHSASLSVNQQSI